MVAAKYGAGQAGLTSKAGTFGGVGAREAPKTGWTKWADGKMRFEIDDSKAIFIKEKTWQWKDHYDFFSWQTSKKLWDILEHKDLFKQYPRLKTLNVKFVDDLAKWDAAFITRPSWKHWIYSEDWYIALWKWEYWDLNKSTLLHEIQHAIQEREWFARGGSPWSFIFSDAWLEKLIGNKKSLTFAYPKLSKAHSIESLDKWVNIVTKWVMKTYKDFNETLDKLKKIRDLNRDPAARNIMYKSLAWEVEARNVEKRLWLSTKERKLQSPESTEDIPRAKQIIRMKNDGQSALSSKAGSVEIPNFRESSFQKYTDNSQKVARERFNIANLEKIWSGSDRDVYQLPDWNILKVAKTARWLWQNNSADYLLQQAGIIPNVIESGKNYNVFEKVTTFKNATKWEKDLIKWLIDDISIVEREIDSRGNVKDWDKVQNLLEKHWWEDLMSYDLWSFWFGDVRATNMGIKNGKPILLDEGTVWLKTTITTYKWVKNLSDPEFREIYQESKNLKKQYGDIDDKTMYSIAWFMITGYVLNTVIRNDK